MLLERQVIFSLNWICRIQLPALSAIMIAVVAGSRTGSGGAIPEAMIMVFRVSGAILAYARMTGPFMVFGAVVGGDPSTYLLNIQRPGGTIYLDKFQRCYRTSFKPTVNQSLLSGELLFFIVKLAGLIEFYNL